MGVQVCATEQVQIQEDIAVPRRESEITAWCDPCLQLAVGASGLEVWLQ
jgi:hypothetical protein